MEGTGHGQKCCVSAAMDMKHAQFIGIGSHEMTWRGVQHLLRQHARTVASLERHRDLKMQTETFKEAFDAFVAVTDDRTAIFLPIFNTNTNVATVGQEACEGKGNN